jgi:hypothetical protein
MFGRGNNRNQRSRRDQRPMRQHERRIPRTLTANAPFLVGKNQQLVSTPSHTDGLTVQRAVRINQALTAGDSIVSYQQIFDRFLGELNITLAANGRLAFSPMWVNCYFFGAPGFVSIALRLFDEPRSNVTAGAFVNTPYFEAVDTSSGSGACSIKARVPKGATYTISSDDATNLKALPYLGFGAQTVGQVIVDVGGTWTIKGIAGSTFQ